MRKSRRAVAGEHITTDTPNWVIGRWGMAFYAICRVIAVGSSRLYFPGRVVGGDRLPRHGPYVLAPIHRSNVDWLIAARVTRRRLRYLVKGEVWKVKSVGHFLELLGAFPVRRGAADRESMAKMLEVLAGGEPVVLFPEGTRRSGPFVEDLKDGAAYLALRAGVPIFPVGLAGTEAAMPRGAKFPRPHRVQIVVHPPLGPTVGDTSLPDNRRVTRSAMRELGEQLTASLQGAFDDAQALLGAEPLVGSSPSAAPSASDGGHGLREFKEPIPGSTDETK